MDQFIKQKLADMLARGIKLSGLEATVRQQANEIDRLNIILSESKQ